MLRPLIVLLLVSTTIALAQPSDAFPWRRSLNAEDYVGWSPSGPQTISYFNYCTGWIWAWAGWEDGEQVGVQFDDLPGQSRCLNTSWVWVYSPMPSGYGFTGTISVESAVGCIGTTLASMPWIPRYDGWNLQDWGSIGVPDPFLLLITWGNVDSLATCNSTYIGSDHPQHGPTGPAACGVCYPSSRVSQTYYYGINGSLCPGVPFSDSNCAVELLVAAKFTETVSRTHKTWGQIKALYR